MIVDCFTFFNEYDLLESRLEFLFKKVNYFVISECNMTFSGQPKRYNFIDNIDRYAYYMDRIIYLPCIASPMLGQKYWGVEHFQRNNLQRAVALLDPNDYVIMGDIDEIPSFSGIDKAIDQLDRSVAVTLVQDLYYYNLNQVAMNQWYGNVVTRAREMRQKKPQEYRDMRNTYPPITEAGWHLSHWGGVEKIREKIQASSHREMNTPQFTDTNHIQKCIDEGIDLYGRSQEQYVKTSPEQFDPFFYRLFSRE